MGWWFCEPDYVLENIIAFMVKAIMSSTIYFGVSIRVQSFRIGINGGTRHLICKKLLFFLEDFYFYDDVIITLSINHEKTTVFMFLSDVFSTVFARLAQSQGGVFITEAQLYQIETRSAKPEFDTSVLRNIDFSSIF